MVKPIGPLCNLDCDYCFYLAKSKLFQETTDFRISDQILERFVENYITSQPGPEVAFAWQGGEPSLMGVEFFRRVVEMQKKFLPPGWRATNALQTNGTLLTEEWARFLKQENFLVGLSLDGPAIFHDIYRRDRQGGTTWDQVVRGLKLLQKYQVETNVLCVVNSKNAAQPLATYRALRDLDIDFLQFIPLVERLEDGKLSERSVTGLAYGRFLIAVFNQWLKCDLGSVFVQIFEETLSTLAGLPPTMCTFLPQCGRQLVMEHNGDLYSCDHYVDPQYRLGNIMETPLAELVNSRQQIQFGQAKADLNDQCLACPVLTLCQGGCPKNRHNGLNALCDGYLQFFSYVQPFVKEILNTLQKGEQAIVAREHLIKLLTSTWGVHRNDACPCGSGLKFKKCCAGIG